MCARPPRLMLTLTVATGLACSDAGQPASAPIATSDQGTNAAGTVTSQASSSATSVASTAGLPTAGAATATEGLGDVTGGSTTSANETSGVGGSQLAGATANSTTADSDTTTSGTTTSAANGGSGGVSSAVGTSTAAITGAGGSSNTVNGATASSGTDGAGGTGGTPNPDPSCGSHKWACWPMPNPAGSGLPNPASYTDNGDGSVLDNVTGLTWQRDQPNQNYNWTAAINYCESLSLAGYSDWRMPTRIEITSVLDYSKSGAKWAGEAFPGASGGFHHSGSDWILTITQTGAGAGNDFAWAFNMSDGILSNAYSKGNSTPVRCVRGGGSGEGPSEPAIAPPDQYVMIATGEVRDNYTGLIWQSGDSESMLSWQQAVGYCENLNLNDQSWRLPSIRELSTLVDEAAVAPSINEAMFPDTQYGARSNHWYWASHQQGNAAWALNFDDGFTGFNSGSAAWNTFGPSWARCVR